MNQIGQRIEKNTSSVAVSQTGGSSNPGCQSVVMNRKMPVRTAMMKYKRKKIVIGFSCM